MKLSRTMPTPESSKRHRMIDVHCHVLPGIDDGSRSVEMSLEMLHELKRQGVHKVIATPHFYPMSDSPEHFLKARNEAYLKLKEHLDDDCPEMALGAEVMYFEGISRYEGLRDFRVSGTKMLLLEMPFMPWTSRAIDEVIRLSASSDLIIMLAHIERYFRYQKRNFWERSIWEVFAENGILMQSNAEALLDKKTRRITIKNIKNGIVSFIGTDSHNMTSRAPNLEDAYLEIENALGSDYVEDLIDLQERFYGTAGIQV